MMELPDILEPIVGEEILEKSGPVGRGQVVLEEAYPIAEVLVVGPVELRGEVVREMAIRIYLALQGWGHLDGLR